MKMTITGIQVTCSLLMGLITLFLAFLPHTNSNGEKHIHYARKLLMGGTFAIAIHFILQYILHKNWDNIEETRSIINLLFGIPITYFFNLSYLYLLREGNILRHEWWIAPIALILSAATIPLSHTTYLQEHDIRPTTIMFVIYATTLLYYRALLIHSFFKIKKNVQQNQNSKIQQLIDWTKWSLLILVLIAFGFPFMTFCTSLTIRAIYGGLAISSCFFYILCFIGYGISCNTIMYPLAKDNRKAQSAKSKEPSTQMDLIIDKFIKSSFYTNSGITLKDTAVQMGISCHKLREWLRSTKYEKFNNWIVALRIEKSKALLLEHPELNSQEIAEQCGFCDRQYFQHLFFKKEGITPSKWVKEHQYDIKSKDSSSQE